MTNRFDDEIIEGIKSRRQAHAESLDYDLERITKDLQRQEQKSGTEVVTRAPRKPQVKPKRSSVFNTRFLSVLFSPDPSLDRR